MLDIRKVDRITVTSNANMEVVIQWYLQNQNLEFKSPLDKGYVDLQEETLGFSFEHKNNKTNICIYVTDKSLGVPTPIVSFDYYISTDKYTNIFYHTPKEKRNSMKMLLYMDNTIEKEITKYKALMYYMAYHREYVERKEVKNTGVVSDRHTPTTSISTPRTLPISSKVYIIDNVDKKALNVKRKYTKPDYEIEYRGFLRHYKSGKVGWVNGFTKGKGKGKKKAFTAWEGSFQNADVVRQGYELNVKPVVVSGKTWRFSAVNIDQENIILDTMKPAEDGSDDIVLRFYEAKKGAVKAKITLNIPVKRVALCDMLENELEEMTVNDGCISLDFKAFEVKTIRCHMT